VVLLVGLALSFWPRGAGTQMAPMPGLDPPSWGSLNDLLMIGPDSGEWARNALHVHHGRFDQVDPHRMPTWLTLTALLIGPTGGVAPAGHLLNHLLHVALVLTLYGLGRAGGGRGVGLVAAGLGAFAYHLVSDSRSLGVDMLVATAIPASLFGGLLAARVWFLAPLGGALAAIASFSHITTLPYTLPALVLVLLRGRGGWRRRLASPVGFVVGALLVIGLVHVTVGLPTPEGLRGAVAEGIVPQVGKQTDAQVALSLDVMELGSATAIENAIRVGVAGVQPGWLPWGLAVFLVWLGVLGPGLGRGAARSVGRLRQVLSRCDLGLGVPLLLCLAPLPLLQAAGAPERYSDNLLGVVAVLMARGLVGPLRLGELGLRRLWRAWPVGLLSLGVGLGVAWSGAEANAAWRQPSPPHFEGVLHARLAALLGEHLEPGHGVATTARAALVMADLELCPRSFCPQSDSVPHVTTCLQLMALECPGPDQLVWVSTDWAQLDPSFVNRQSMTAWIAARWPEVGRVVVGDRGHRVFLVPREDVADLGGKLQ